MLTLPSKCRSRNRDSSDQATFFQSSIVQFWWACVNCSLRFLFLADKSGTRCGLLLLWHICFRVRHVVVFRDGILHTLVVTSGYLSYCCLSSQSAHSALTSTRHFCPHNCHLGLWRYWILYYRGEAATNIAVMRLIARHPPQYNFFWHGRTCANAWSAAPARCRATAHCSRSQISLITWREALSASAS